MSSDPELVITSDGSHTLRVTSLNENYHSTHGALQESMHVFIHNGLDNTNLNEIRVLEVGFGTGLNALLTAKAAANSCKEIFYSAIEPFPLSADLTSQLNYPQIIDHAQAKLWFEKIHSAEWGKETSIHGGFKLLKQRVTLQSVNLPGNFFDLVYFDAFAPQKQAEMWTREMFSKCYDSMSDESSLVTYCAKGQVKRDLRSVGFLVESLAGPPGKREMIRAIRRKS
jgi:tRNA U34 5-methylaminomethyl-2-thiouridine-forming methyltransferase MnmC